MSKRSRNPKAKQAKRQRFITLPFVLSLSTTLLLLSACKKTYNYYNYHPGHHKHGYQVSTLAGDTAKGYVNGSATTTRFDAPGGLAIDVNDNVFVTDINNNRVRFIRGTGLTTTYGDNGPTLQFQFPLDVAVDMNGNAYIADTFNHRIRKIDRNGLVTTIAGDGTYGFANGTGIATKFAFPTGITIDAAGNLYVNDAMNFRIRKISPAGVVTTFAGSGTYGNANGPAASAQFGDLIGITVDDAGNVYVSDVDNNQIRKISTAGMVSVYAGDGTAGYHDGYSAQFDTPLGIATDHHGNLYVSDSGNNRIRMINSAGETSTIAGGNKGFANGPAASARFNLPRGIALDAAGNIYVADQGNNQVRKISLN